MNQILQNILDIIQQNEKLSEDEKNTLLKSLQDVDKELMITAFKLERTEKVKKTTAILLEETIEELEQKRKAVEEQNRELEIEASLERVRAVAMGMNKSDDLLSICEISFKEFKKLGFDNIRNALIHIQYDNQKYFMDYDFSDLTGGAITKIDYGSHPIVEDYLKQIRSTKDAFYQGVIEEDQLEEWKNFRRNSGQIDDPRLDKATALYYYFFSIGIGDIGISTLKSIDESQIKILKRFRNVFSLSYQRYIDIALSETQAREAQIELALERVRARTMAMQHSEELHETSFVLFDQLRNLGETAEQLSIGIFNENKGVIELSVTLAGNKLPKTYEVPFDEPFIMGKAYQAWKEKKKSFVYELSGKTLKDYNQYRNRVFGGKLSSKEKSYTKRIVYFAFFSKGVISFSSHEERPSETILLFERFAAVFDLTYTRFNDLKKAEEQAREAKIEVALERIRTRATAMHTSDELQDVATILREQMGLLGQPELETCVVDLFEENSDKVISWYAFRQPELSSGKIVTGTSSFSWRSSELTREMMMIYRSGQKECTLEVEGEKANEFLQVLVKASPEIVQYTGESIPDKMCYHITFFSGGALLMVSYLPPSDEAKTLQRRAAFVFDMAYRRYSDLKKAEAQARESEIELALERVRARTMGMQKSDELKDVIQLVYEQFVQLKIHTEHTGFIMDYKMRDDYNSWIADRFGTPSQITIPYFDCIYYNRFNDTMEKGLDFFEVTLSFEEKNKFYNGLFQHIPGFPEESKKTIFEAPAFAISTVLLENVALYIENFAGVPYSEEENNTLMRFGKVFQQTYTRFLDLQKAEAQARESQIQLALERVRARTMAMHHSDELQDAAKLLFQQIKLMGIETGSCGFNIWNNDEKTAIVWVSSPEGGLQEPFSMPHTVSNLYREVHQAKEDKQNYFVKELKGKVLQNHFDYLLTLPGIGAIIKRLRETGYQFPEKIFFHFAFFAQGYLSFHLHKTNFEAAEIFQRFAIVFEQTYTRFLDLQKAEAQAKEAKIEASLEKVRAAAMSMHKSEDLLNVSETLYGELIKLGLEEIRNAMINIHNDGNKTFLNYDYSDEIGKSVTLLDFNTHPVMEKQINQSRMANDAFSEAVYTGKDLEAWKEFRRRYGEKDDPRIENITALYYYFYSIGNGTIGISTFSPVGEEKLSLLKRFRNVFNLAYQRYSDLALAEAQAREAQIEAALERVRSKAMAMNSSEDLAITVDTFFTELNKLGIVPHRCGVGIVDPETQIADIRATVQTKEGVSKKIIGKLKLAGHPVLDKVFECWKLKKEYHPVLRGSEISEYYKVMNPQVTFPNFADDEIQYGHYFQFKEGGVFAWTDKVLKEEDLQIFRRYTSVLSLTYRRYAELKESEAQAKEAKIEASLEKVRSQTMAMQKSDELKEVIQIVYEQFVHLNIIVEHTGFLVDYRESDDYKHWIADPHGELSKITIPYFDSTVYNRFKEAIEKGEDFLAINLSFEEKNKFYKKLFEYIPGITEEVTEFYFRCPGLALSMVLLDNICLYIENFSGIPYTDAENNILMRIGKVFQQTYTRFLDLQKAEAQTREAQIEAALERVRARTMGMHLSSELHDVIKVVMEQLLGLGLRFNVTNFAKIHPDGSWDLWLFTPDQPYPAQVYVPYLDHPIFNLVLENIKTGADFFTDIYDKDKKDIFFHHFFENTIAKNSPEERKNYVYNTKGFARSLFLTRNIWFAVVVYDTTPFTDEENAILKRFAGVFEQTYTRFLDLQKAEAQAREAKIESSLERVRARAMSMHTPNDLSATVSLFFNELKSLSVLPWRCGVGRIDEETRTTYLTTTSITKDGDYTEVSGKLKQTGHPVLDGIFDHWKLQKEYYPVLRGDEINEYYSIIKPQIAYPDYPLDAVQYGHNIPFKEGFIFAWTENKLSEEELGIFRRFASVLSLTYRRYLDIKESEEQNRIIQAENDRKTKELEEARQLQLSMLPKELPRLPHLDIAVYMKPATEVGGDYYDFNICNDGTLTILVCDATGHGMMSGMMVSIMKSIFISNRNNIDLKEFFENTNNSLKEMHLGRLMMASLGVQITSEKIIATNAGMPSLLYFRNKSKKAGEFVSNNLPLGAMRGIKYSLKEIKYEKGDTLLLMSDGLAELRNKNNEQYGYNRVKEEFRSVEQKSSNEIVEHLKISATKWNKDVEPDDDVTFVVIKVI